jgi:hypothetical protein
MAPSLAPGLVADILLDRVYAAVDDPHRIHTPQALGLQALSRAQEWVSIRFALLRRTFPLTLAASVPLYDRFTVAPEALTLLSASRAGVPLALVPYTALRYRDPQWLATSGTPDTVYCIRWSLWGFYPVPAAATTVVVTCQVVASSLVHIEQPLSIPESYAERAEQVAIGLLLLGRERHFQAGVTFIQRGLDLSAAQMQAFLTRGGFS